MADHILNQQRQPVSFRPFLQFRIRAQIVFEIGIGDQSVPQMEYHLFSAQRFSNTAVYFKQPESFLQFIFSAFGNMLRKGFLAVHNRDIQLN